MKVQFILAACLVAAAFAAPVENFIDPDCVEEDMVIEEPMADIEAEFGLSEPSLRVDFGANNDAECEDDIPEASPEPTTAVEECEDEPIEPTTAEPEPETDACVSEIAETEAPAPEPTAAECEEPEETTPEPADECEEGESNEEAPEIGFRIEPAHVLSDLEIIGEEQELPVVEECEE